jgi:RNA polymerase sigma-B factor
LRWEKYGAIVDAFRPDGKGWKIRSQTLSERPRRPRHAPREIVPGRLVPSRGASGLPRPEPKRASTRDTARRLLRDYHERGDLGARDRLIQQYMPLVKSLARRYSVGTELYEDLVQVGCIGLIKAVDRFDPQRAEFGQFVIPNVAGEIKRYLRDRAWPVRVPRRLQELRPGLRACSAELSAQLARPATISEIADRSGIAEQEVAEALDTERIQSPLSLSHAAAQEDEAYCDLDVLEGGYERGEQRALLAAAFRALDERERRLLHLRYFAGLSQPQIAEEVGISPIHVSRLTRRALVKLRAELGSMAPEALAS